MQVLFPKKAVKRLFYTRASPLATPRPLLGSLWCATRKRPKGWEILCDDRNIVRVVNKSFRLYGTWSHGDVPDISSQSAPLKGIFFLEKADINQIEHILDTTLAFKKLLACLIRPLTTSDWWEKSLDTVSLISKNIPCWQLKFDKSGNIFDTIKQLSEKGVKNGKSK